MSIMGLTLQFGVVLLLVIVSALVGYVIARHRYRLENAARIALLSSETSKMRRRAALAEDKARSAENALTRERRKTRR